MSAHTVTHAPLTSSVSTSSATWVAVPMGHLDDPLNTFWELFSLPRGGARWSLATPRGMADNGGLVAAVGAGRSALIGIRPSNQLHFSSVNSTRDLGTSYAVGALPRGLIDRPDALATSTRNSRLALVAPREEVLSSSGRLSTWSALLTAGAAAKQPSSAACRLTSLDAVAFDSSGEPLVGGACNRPGAVGLYDLSGNSIRPQQVHLAAAMTHDTITVLRLDRQGSSTAALLLARRGHRQTVVAVVRAAPGRSWQAGAPYPLAAGQQIRATSSSPAGYGMLLSSPDGRLAYVEQTAAGWTRLPSLPAATSAVVTPAGQPPQAITVKGSIFGAWRYDPAERRWRHVQSISVPIQYGSSG